MRLSFEVSDSERLDLSELADRLKVPVEALMALALRDLLHRREATFDAAAQHVVAKNAALYRRLA